MTLLMNLVLALGAFIFLFTSIWTFYVLLFPTLAFLKNTFMTGQRPAEVRGSPRIVVIIPAHNMSLHIQRCIGSLRNSSYVDGSVQIFVAADHCTDQTVALASLTDAEVLVRNEGPRGKTYTLNWALEMIAERRVQADLYVIVDATVRVEPGFLTALADHWSRGENIVIGHPVLDSENQKWFARCLGLTLSHRNLQNWSRAVLGNSSLIGGRGMGFDREYINRFGWSLALPTADAPDAHPTEDWRHGVRAAENGYHPSFVDEARLLTPLRDSFGAATEQGLRWEKGRILNVRQHALPLLSRGLKERSLTKIIAALDAIQPPVAVLAILCLIPSAIAVATSTPTAVVLCSAIPAVMMGLYGSLVILQGHREGIGIETVLWAPVYLAWRFISFSRALVGLAREK